jgi:hypothetical protein
MAFRNVARVASRALMASAQMAPVARTAAAMAPRACAAMAARGLATGSSVKAQGNEPADVVLANLLDREVGQPWYGRRGGGVGGGGTPHVVEPRVARVGGGGRCACFRANGAAGGRHYTARSITMGHIGVLGARVCVGMHASPPLEKLRYSKPRLWCCLTGAA